ncbi:substrate-binding domain-containing protein, partial [Burkholderia ambifaria]|uniref:substrate-binding domain-containing protein n=1 Tax=Burkholderia ambifaria TaxID=152480 RepID=UPI001E4AAC1A
AGNAASRGVFFARPTVDAALPVIQRATHARHAGRARSARRNLPTEVLGTGQLDVPSQLSITGFDDVALAREIRPSLTTMWVDTAAFGRKAAHALLDALGNGEAAPGCAVLPELRVRESAAPPPPARAAQ